MRAGILALGFSLLLAALSGCASEKPYRFGIAIDQISSPETASEKQRAFEHFAKALSDRLGRPVTVELVPTGGDEAKALELGTIDIALLKAVPYGHAKAKNARIAGLATVVSRNENEEETTHSGYIIALNGSPIERIGDLKGKRFGFVRSSASGLAYPHSYLAKQGLDFSAAGAAHVCFRNNAELIEALNAGRIDAGTTYRSQLLKPNSDLAHFKIIARVSNIPNPLIAVSASLTEGERRKLTAALTGLPESAFQGVGFFGLKPLDEKLYEPVVELGAANICD